MLGNYSDRYLKKETEFVNWSKNILILIENSVCFLQTLCPQVKGMDLQEVN